jgi:membrane protease YdiL (CAAX protease family)
VFGIPAIVEPLYLPSIYILPGIALGASGAAFFITALVYGKAGVLGLLKRFLLWRVAPRWFVFAILGLPLIKICVGSVLMAGPEPFKALAPSALILYPGAYFSHFYFGPLFEEAAWRGFALPRLQKRFGPLTGTLILGVLWGLWHLPVYLPSNIKKSGLGGGIITFLVFMLVTLGLTIIFTWLFNNTRGSLLLAVLLHASVDGTATYIHSLAAKDVISPVAAGNIELGLMIGCVALALILLITTRGGLNYAKFLRTADPSDPSLYLKDQETKKPG